MNSDLLQQLNEETRERIDSMVFPGDEVVDKHNGGTYVVVPAYRDMRMQNLINKYISIATSNHELFSHRVINIISHHHSVFERFIKRFEKTGRYYHIKTFFFNERHDRKLYIKGFLNEEAMAVISKLAIDNGYDYEVIEHYEYRKDPQTREQKLYTIKDLVIEKMVKMGYKVGDDTTLQESHDIEEVEITPEDIEDATEYLEESPTINLARAILPDEVTREIQEEQRNSIIRRRRPFVTEGFNGGFNGENEEDE